ncbi:hypothetical protein Bca52824_001801 [Brassica carinata]|uniref:FMN-dependent dehydrogenase domain-containing protein n=1 Tax=Brassica carinata TaxID=52824 RepID=A0A8X7WJB2_BRACI|nr:hypothetical protein Bca52824_001801 [Brassica carinata]
MTTTILGFKISMPIMVAPTAMQKMLTRKVYKNRNVVEQLVKRAEKAGFKAIALTVDTPRLGRRESDIQTFVYVWLLFHSKFWLMKAIQDHVEYFLLLCFFLFLSCVHLKLC